MARWHLSSNALADRAAGDICEKAGLLRSGEHSADDGCRIRAYRKRVMPCDNFVTAGAQDWICTAGTLVFNGKLGREALSACFQRFVSDGIDGIRDEALGHYAVAIRKANEIWAFTDPLGAFDLYYLTAQHEWFVSNSLEVCAGAASSRKLDPLRLLVQTLQTYFPGEETFYSDVKRLLGCQAIHIDLRTRHCSVEAIPPSQSSQNWELPNIEEAVCRYQAEVREVFRNLASIGPVGVFGTGGLDSRTVLSALVDQKADLQLMYGIGNSRLTDYDSRDALLAQQVAHEAGVSFQRLDWSGQQPHTMAKLAAFFVRYGFRSEIYGASDSFLDSLGGAISPYPQLLMGGYSPAFSSFKPWELDRNSFTFEELVADSMRFQGNYVARSQCLLDKASYARVVSDAVRRTLALHGLDYPEQGADLRMFVRAKLLLYVRPESRLLNLVNEFCPYIAPFMIRRLYDPLLEVPFEYRKRDEFQLRLIHSLAPRLVRIPLYSGICPAHIDQATFRLVRDPEGVQNSAAKRLVDRVKPVIARRAVKAALRGLRKLATEPNDRNAAIRRAYSRQIMHDPLGKRWFGSVAEFTPKDLARICQYLVGVNLMGYTVSDSG